MEILAIIPARGGSRGVPRKNLTAVAGVPLIGRTIGAALATASVSRVIVSTDDDEIADTARRYGAEVLRRPKKLSGDRASSESALLHALDRLRRREGYDPDLVVFLQCTSPLTHAEDIDGAVRTLTERQADVAFTATRFRHFLWREDDELGSVGINHDRSERQMRQDRPAEYLETGAVYVMRTDGFRRAGHRFFGQVVVHEVPRWRAVEIDDAVDLDVAEALARRGRHEAWARQLPQRIGVLFLDFDGVMTDDRVLVDQKGREAVLCHRGDGARIAALRDHGIPIVVLTAETNPVVKARCTKLRIECHGGLGDKLPVMREWLEQHGVDAADAVYLGNDINDIDCMRAVGCGVAVADAHRDVRAAARFVLDRPGGHGAVKVLIERIFQRLGAS